MTLFQSIWTSLLRFVTKPVIEGVESSEKSSFTVVARVQFKLLMMVSARPLEAKGGQSIHELKSQLTLCCLSKHGPEGLLSRGDLWCSSGMETLETGATRHGHN